MRSRTLILGLILLAVSSVSVRSDPNSSSPVLRIPNKSQAHLTPAQHKISPLLRRTCSALEEANATSTNAATLRIAERFSSSLVKVDDAARVQVYLKVDFVDDDIQEILKSVGVEIEIVNEEWNLIQAWVPYDYIEIIADFEFILKVQPPDYPIPMTGSVRTEGDILLNAVAAFNKFGVDGSGIRVGVISDGVDSRAASQATGDLPVFAIANAHPGSGDEGTAMLEIIHDLAPGAQLAFCGPATCLAMDDCIQVLAAPSPGFLADIIVDDLGCFGEPFFQDGMIAQAAAAAIAGDASYVSSAGNQASVHYEATFLDSFDGVHSHQIGVGNTMFNVTGNPATVVLQWSNMFGGSADDYDLCLFEESPATCAGFNTRQDGNDDLIESFSENCSAGCSLQVRKVSGLTNQTIELFVLGTNAALDNADTITAGSVFGHPAVPGVFAVAAAHQATPGTIQSSSNRGPSDIHHPSFVSRAKPDLTAVDCVTNTGPGTFPTKFCGTSAAAPHVAAIAAMLLEAHPHFTPAQVYEVLTKTAVDIEGGGFDSLSGFGRVDALAALNATTDCSGVAAPTLEEINARADLSFSNQSLTGTQILKAQHTITAGTNTTIPNGAAITFRSNTSRLAAGFSAQLGATLRMETSNLPCL